MSEQPILAAVLAVTALGGGAATSLALRPDAPASWVRSIVAKRMIGVTLIGAAELVALLGRG